MILNKDFKHISIRLRKDFRDHKKWMKFINKEMHFYKKKRYDNFINLYYKKTLKAMQEYVNDN